MNPVREYTEAQLSEEIIQAMEISDPAPEPVVLAVVSDGDRRFSSDGVQPTAPTTIVLVTPEVVITPPPDQVVAATTSNAVEVVSMEPIPTTTNNSDSNVPQNYGSRTVRVSCSLCKKHHALYNFFPIQETAPSETIASCSDL